MLKQERLNKITKIIRDNEYGTTEFLAKTLDVSNMTIRRDLDELEKQGQVTKIYGGAKIINKELSTEEKQSLNIDLKQQIAKKVASIAQDGQTIFLGAGTTVIASMPQLINRNILFITNSLPVFDYMTNLNEKVILTGGKYHKTTQEFVGEAAINSIRTINIDVAFGSTNGINKNNITTANVNEGTIQTAVFSRSELNYILCDHTKFDSSDTYTFETLDNINGVITDDKISEELLKKYRKLGKII
ncbi:DeoR/GlpR family DNA-binding transcription regulator [Lactobacillus sp. YT155]|uniref:DeoR/GlpR family DNA-binding transcription regulator n=1 Tax=Lactobacillus sp. YT155 TaxID=3060955 RepID=UPI00265F8726|nr:DeoR/GlpR family DNA-binding transcription regulator [Lactobacillus sp. YT155]MDO1604921.1 DeoR/GlpR family DNA-binding transcription regulator [Lactobacillus sp. YT155]